MAGRLLADIGGTNARFALQSGTTRPRAVRVLKTRDFPDLATAVESYLAAEIGGTGTPRRAAFAVASPVLGDSVEMTNNSWSFSIAALGRRLKLDELRVINDFAAVARAVPALGAGDILGIGGGSPIEGAPIAVLGPGTGLGVSALVPAGGDWIPLATEGGHVTLAAADEREDTVIATMRRSFGHVSAERALSGAGLLNLYAALAALEAAPLEKLEPDQVTERGLAGTDPLCFEAISMFCAMLGTVAGNLALSLGALGGVYIGGGIVPKLGTFFAESTFRARFEDKGRFRDYTAAIPTTVITRELPAFLGLAALLDAGT